MSRLILNNNSLKANVMDLYQQYIHISRYSRYNDKIGRRETWGETVQRYIDFFNERSDYKYDDILNADIAYAIQNLDVMPSMRALMTAGEALKRENISGYNCAYVAINTVASFSESLYVLMCGTGVGFSCERQEVNQLPKLPDSFTMLPFVIVVKDSKEGWSFALSTLIDMLYAGNVPHDIDYSLVRPPGARLKTFGGRASGPEPLRKLLTFVQKVVTNAAGRRLTSIEVHDIMCMIGEVVVVGGVRRSALISLSNLSDNRMRDAKSGQWWIDTPYRALANNSVAYTEKPNSETFMSEWLSLIKSKSGERGIFNRVAAQKQAAKVGRDATLNYGCNPCSEIILRDKQFCNLTEVIIRADDTEESLREKVNIATILGTFQSTLTDFNFISYAWVENTMEERLLGVSLTGIMDNKLTDCNADPVELGKMLNRLRDYARSVNLEWSKKLGINPAAAITCVKPSGTVSQLCNTASGIHARHNSNYIRTVRIDKKDPLYKFMLDKGFSIEDCAFKPDSTAIISFGISAPDGAVIRDDVGALVALEHWLNFQENWCEHKPSITVTVKDDEWMDVGAWVYKNFDKVSGVSFLPFSDHTYQQAPYQDMSKKEYDKWVAANPTPKFSWTELSKYEHEDNTVAMQTLACVAGVCELP
jgi:ribonucleoside-triphosphate reductase (thioredoxin)